jgi:DASS family divalent anion:Na+ symporter
MMGLCAFLVTGVLSWDDCLKESSAWDTLSWFAVLVGMSGMLNQLGIVKFFADTVAAALAAAHLGSMQVRPSGRLAHPDLGGCSVYGRA